MRNIILVEKAQGISRIAISIASKAIKAKVNGLITKPDCPNSIVN